MAGAGAQPDAQPHSENLSIQSTDVDDQPWDETKDERAAIIQYDGGATRTWAEALARLIWPARPATSHPSGGCDLSTTADSSSTMAGPHMRSGWGWGPLDLFGCDRTKPFARLNRAGLLWLLNGRKLLALAADTAAIATASGGHFTFRRFRELGGVLAWGCRSVRRAFAFAARRR